MTDTPSTAQYLTREQVHALIDAAKPGRDRLFIRVAWETGARVSEIIGLRYSDVRATVWSVRFGMAGGPQSTWRYVPICDSLAAELDLHAGSLLRGRDPATTVVWLFEFTRYTAFRMVRDTARRAGLVLEGGRDITPDALRAAFTMNLILQDVPLSVVQELVGQASIKGVSAHAKTDPARVREYLRKVEF